MSFSDQIRNEYFDWLYDYVCKGRAHKDISYKRLFIFLHDVEFTFTIENDSNRAYDGICLRRRFAHSFHEDDYKYVIDILDGPCSVLEMLVALSIRCEEEIMDDPRYGDRVKQWFWSMLKTMGINMMTDEHYSKDYAEKLIINFLNRHYEPDGRGGLFYIPKCKEDLRKLEIWTQMCWYLNEF